jgi:type VI secretion system protein ImpK
MAKALEHYANDAQEAADVSPSSGNLALLYEGLLTGIVRLQSSRQRIPDSESFRKRTKATLQEIEHVASSGDYDAQDVRDTHFAVIAFLDSVVLHSSDPVRAEWERKTLQEELFGQTDAGVVFFEKLERFLLRRDSHQLANILEVYLLCLLLGFQGRYSGGLRGELDSIVERTRKRIDSIRGRSRNISPAGLLPPESMTAKAPERRRADRLPLYALAALGITLVWFLVLKLDLVRITDQLLSKLR